MAERPSHSNYGRKVNHKNFISHYRIVLQPSNSTSSDYLENMYTEKHKAYRQAITNNDSLSNEILKNLFKAVCPEKL